jgi:four helix bundle protein
MQNEEEPRDLEDRTFLFAESVRRFANRPLRTLGNTEDVRQLVRASGSVAANWIEADEALRKKDFLMRLKICRKEAKESRLFLRLVDIGLTKNNRTDHEALASEARELTANLFVDNLEERRVMRAFSLNLGIEFCMGFGIWSFSE